MRNTYLLCALTHGLTSCQGKKEVEGSMGAWVVGLAGRDGELNRQREHEWEPEMEIEKRIRNR